MIVLQTIAVAFAMFSALPVPQFAWNEKNMRYALCAFPLVGLLCGALWCVCGVLPLPALPAAGFCLVPVWVTGGIHLDGYADTCDALSSYGDREKKLEILKDPHCGAFAVIRLCSYFAAYLALRLRAVHAPGGRALDAGADFGTGAFRPGRGGVSHGEKHRPCPHFCHGADRTAVRRVLMVLAVLLCAALLALGGGHWCWRRCWCLSVSCCGGASSLAASPAIWPGGFCKSRAVDAGGAVCLPVGRTVMIFITGPLYSGKRTFARACPAAALQTCRQLAAGCKDNAELEKLADELSAYDIVMATEVGGGVVPVDAAERAARENAGRLACLLAARAGAWCRCSAASPPF